mmetsp:Transcript_43425/g.73255  ORF Transcript_43425/g.73255 Transcript_43425/m.73255 type:complete len:85 (+) Transcript_43425:1424-1678(+)
MPSPHPLAFWAMWRHWATCPPNQTVPRPWATVRLWARFDFVEYQKDVWLGTRCQRVRHPPAYTLVSCILGPRQIAVGGQPTVLD